MPCSRSRAALAASLAFLAAPSLADATANLVPLTNSSARCLDGSRAAFYLQRGAPGNTTVVFFLEGGGLCSHLEDCMARTKSDLGSSKNFAQTIELPSFQSSDPVANPDWHGANMVFLPYCSGDLHSGTRTEASVATWGLHFSGAIIVHAMIDQLKATESLGEASLAVVAGGSAGGIGVFYNVDWITARLPNVRVLGMPIGGFLFAHASYDGPGAQDEAETASVADFQRDAKLFQGVAAHNTACAAAHQATGDTWRCMMPSVLFHYTSTPLYIVESQIDSVIMFGFSDVPQVNTSAVDAYVEAFRRNSSEAADSVALSRKDTIFSVCCFMHTNFDRGSPMMGDSDYYDMLRRVVAAPAGLPPPSLIDTCAGLQCGSHCPAFP